MERDDIRHAPLAMDAATFRTLGHRLVDQLAALLEAVPRGPVTRDESPSAVRDALDLSGPLPDAGVEPGPLLERTAQLLFELAVTVLKLLDLSGELTHLVLQPIEPHHQLGFGHLRARRREQAQAGHRQREQEGQ